MQHKGARMGSQVDLPEGAGTAVTSNSIMIENNLKATFSGVRTVLLTLVLISPYRGAATG
jgi:hypothetical protein